MLMQITKELVPRLFRMNTVYLETCCIKEETSHHIRWLGVFLHFLMVEQTAVQFLL